MPYDGTQDFRTHLMWCRFSHPVFPVANPIRGFRKISDEVYETYLKYNAVMTVADNPSSDSMVPMMLIASMALSNAAGVSQSETLEQIS
jgi:hypothetical protein